jgi:ligand-binding sensor domain-containing protein/signal transduction histidine kinase
MLLPPSSVLAQRNKIRFEKISIEQGLSQSTVVAIHQDHRGFLWFGTYDGINRFDGYQFKTFRHRPTDSSSLSHNLVKDIFEDHLGTLWVGTEGGLNKFNREKEIFERYIFNPADPTSLSNNRIRDIFEDTRGILWIATEGGLNRYDRQQNTFKCYTHNPTDPNSLSDNLIRAILEDRHGNFWIGADDGLNLMDRDKGTFVHFTTDAANATTISENSITCITEDPDGSLWIGTRGGGLNRFNPQNKKFIRYQSDPRNPASLRHNIIRALWVDQGKDLWVGTYGGGLEKYDRAHDNFIHYQHFANDQYSLSNNAIWCLFEDRSGILWIGTDYGGVNKFDRRKMQFTHYTNDPNDPKSLNNNEVNAFYEDPKDHGKSLWIGTWGGGLSFFDREKETFEVYRHQLNDPASLSNNVVRCICEDQTGTLWLGTDDGLNKFDRKKKTFRQYDFSSELASGIRNNMVKAVYEDRTGTLWVGTYRCGLRKYDRKNDRFIYYPMNPQDPTALNDNIVWCILEDRLGHLWIGTDAGGLNLLDRATDTFRHFMKNPANPNSINDNKVLCIFEDHAGILWLGTAGGGLNRFDPINERFTYYSEDEGLPSNTIQAITEDAHGNLWISTTRGIARFDSTRKQFTNYHVHDGLQSEEFNVDACLKSLTGELFFGGINGFNIIRPDQVQRTSYVPPVVFTEFQLFNRAVPIGKEIDGRVLLKKSISETPEIVLSYRDNVFSLEFAALDFTSPGKNLYAYMMEGVESNWNSISTRRFATYTKLPPGQYTFKVKGANQNGIWNETGTSLNITITPPFWETAWFRGISAVLLVALVITGIQLRTARMRAYNRELQQRVQERTTQLEAANKELETFAYSVSHDLRAPLRAIDGYTHILMEDHETTLNEEGKRICSVITNETQHMSRLIDDLLTLSRMSHAEMKMSLIDMTALAQLVFEELTTSENRDRIDIRIDPLPPIVGDPILIREVWMNLLSNAIKFSSKCEHPSIHVGFQLNESTCTYSVRDNGAGFDMQYANKLFGVFQRLHSEKEFEGTGVGLALIQRLIHRHGGTVWAESELQKGSVFYFTLPQRGHTS